mmetsp:Transcript_5666/g.14450  ORF Transcript_5666/g.14450 Transcript_5666/m.14450 type:complete len:476 (+) Transcript_5666:346-1773(+)
MTPKVLLSTFEQRAQARSGSEPHRDDDQENHAKVWRRCRERSKRENHELLYERTSRLTEGVADDVDRRLALDLRLLVERDVRHFLARVEERVLGSLREDVLRGTNEHSHEERREAERGEDGIPRSGEQDEAEEDGTGEEDHRGRDDRGNAPAELSEDEARNNHEHERHRSGGGGEVAHEHGVVVGVGVLRLNLGLPRHLDEVDGDSVSNNKRGEVTHVRGLGEERDGLADAHGEFLLLLLRGGRLRNVREHVLVHGPVDASDAESANDNHAHESLERDAPSVNAGGKVRADRREEAHSLSGEDESNVGDEAEERVELLRLLHLHDLVGEAPEEHRHDDGAPQLCHHVEKAVRPIAYNCNGTHEPWSKFVEQVDTEFRRVKGVARGVHDERKGAEKNHERHEDRVEEPITVHQVGQASVDGGEADSCGQVDVRLEERDDLSARSGGSHDEHVFGVTQDGVVEEDAEHHESKRDHLL